MGLRLRWVEAEPGSPPLEEGGWRQRWRRAALLLRLRPLPQSSLLLEVGVGEGSGCPSGVLVGG